MLAGIAQRSEPRPGVSHNRPIGPRPSWPIARCVRMIARDSIGLEKGLFETVRIGVQRSPIGRGSVFQTVRHGFNI